MTLEDKRKSIEKQIQEQCNEFESILDILRRSSFNKSKYEKFHETLKQYSKVLAGSTCLDRETAGYLQTFQLYLYAATQYHDKLGEASPFRQELQQAWNQILDLDGDIYFGN